MGKLENYEDALELIAKIGCLQSQDEDEFFCKKDGSKHSIYCPAGIALKALNPTEPGEGMNCPRCGQPMTQVFKCFRCPPIETPGLK